MIAVLAQKEKGGVQYYRSVVPMLSIMREYGVPVQLVLPLEFSIFTASKYKILLIDRPMRESEIHCIYIAKQCGVKVWIDIDDLLWRIPRANLAARTFTEQAADRLLTAMINADVITCSTTALAEHIKTEYDRNAIVIPNAWDDFKDDISAHQVATDGIKILYRGSNTHAGDLFNHRAAFRQYNRIQFLFMGDTPWFLFREYGGGLDMVLTEPWNPDITTYFYRIHQHNPQYFIFPLEDNDFNRCKSNIAAIEATQAGAVCICPAYLPEFAGFPAIHYQDEKHLCEILEEIDASDSELDQRTRYEHIKAEKHIREVLALSKVNELRISIINFLIEK